MKFYFSGLKSQREIDMIVAAGVENLLFDQFQWQRLAPPGKSKILDSGAYFVLKNGGEITVDDYREVAAKALNHGFDHVISPDVVGDPAKTKFNYVILQAAGLDVMPVWGWGADPAYLDFYLEQTDGIIGIGGLVPYMRQRDKTMLRDLVKLCKQHPDRFHLFGVNWCKALNHLAPYAYSADTSKWLDGNRYRTVIHIQTSRAGKQYLTETPVRMLVEKDENYAHLVSSDPNLGNQISVLNAKNMKRFFGTL